MKTRPTRRRRPARVGANGRVPLLARSLLLRPGKAKTAVLQSRMRRPLHRGAARSVFAPSRMDVFVFDCRRLRLRSTAMRSSPRASINSSMALAGISPRPPVIGVSNVSSLLFYFSVSKVQTALVVSRLAPGVSAVPQAGCSGCRTGNYNRRCCERQGGGWFWRGCGSGVSELPSLQIILLPDPSVHQYESSFRSEKTVRSRTSVRSASGKAKRVAFPAMGRRGG
jgi:hypothetical protein